ncbi:NAD(P)H-hydrate dehydratase, partial [archaeon]
MCSGGAEAEAHANVEALLKLMQRMDALVVGPGLGRDETTLRAVAEVITAAGAQQLPTILDGDALFLLSQSPNLLRAHKHAIITPNGAEFERLWAATHDGDKPAAGDSDAVRMEQTVELSKLLHNPVIIRKGLVDVIAGSAGFHTQVSDYSSPRRCGGQGDVLAGATGAFAAWARAAVLSSLSDAELADVATRQSLLMACAVGGSLVARHAASLAYTACK